MSARLIVSGNVQALRLARGWTLAQLAEAIGLGWSEDTTGQALHGRRVWTAEEIAATAAALGTSPGRLFWAGPECPACHGAPPVGFTCNACGLEAR